MLDNAEVDFPEIEYEGKTQRISHGLYSVILNGGDREKRREVFEKYYSASGTRFLYPGQGGCGGEAGALGSGGLCSGPFFRPGAEADG